MRGWVLGALAAALIGGAAQAAPRFESKTADNGGVKIHYTAAGKGPLVVMLHGFPEYWGYWRTLMDELDERYRVVALDLRGYDRSDKPAGVEAYAMPNLVGDVAAVIRAEGRTSATVAGHDWGAAIAWNTAQTRPELVERLVIMSVPHPTTFARELATNPQQQANSQYARNFQQPGFEKNLSAETLTRNSPPAIRAEHKTALERGDIGAMLNYYRANYPRVEPGAAPPPPPVPLGRIKVPVLVIHGLKDNALLHSGHANSWAEVDGDMTLLMLPNAGHDVQHDAPELVNGAVRDWLDRRVKR